MKLTPGSRTLILWLALLGAGCVALALQLMGVLSQSGALALMVGLVAGLLVLNVSGRRG